MTEKREPSQPIGAFPATFPSPNELLLGRPSATITKVPFVAPEWAHGLPLLRAYVDETGDRGPFKGGSSSPVFGMAGVIVDETAEANARSELRELRKEFRLPANVPMSWKQHLKNHERRVHTAKELATVQGLTVVYVAADKASHWPTSYVSNVTLFYNVIAYETLKRILWTAANGRGPQHQVEVRFGHVAKHNSADTHGYFQIKKPKDKQVPFDLMTHLSWVNATEFEMSQIADLYAGFLKAAIWPNQFGDVEGTYLRTVWHQIRKTNNCVLSLGLQLRPNSSIVKAMDWWPCPNCTSQY